MGVLEFLRQRKLRHVESQQLKSRASAAFLRSYPDRQIFSTSDPSPSRITSHPVIMIYWHWDGIPPRRTWWMANSTNDEFHEIPADEVSSHIDVPVWR